MDRFRQILTRYWGYSDFRELQLDIIQSVADGKDTLGLMPTGAENPLHSRCIHCRKKESAL
ncbi:MAG: hypothetical protein ACOCVA_09350 [Prolixibacteraceae bacterium]